MSVRRVTSSAARPISPTARLQGFAYTSTVLADSPVIYLPFDETTTSSGSACADLGSAQTNWSYLTSVTNSVTGVVTTEPGTAVRGGGGDGIAHRSGVPTSLQAGTNMSIEAWVNVSSTSQQGIIACIGDTSTGWGIGVGATSPSTSGNHIIINRSNISADNTAVNIGTGNHHIVVTLDGAGHLTVYLDGASVYTASGVTVNSTTAGCSVGYNGSSTFLSNGVAVDDIAFYATALSATQVLNHYNAGH